MELPKAPKPGEPIYARFLQALRDAIPRVIMGGSGISVKRAGSKIVIENTQRQIIPQTAFWARLTARAEDTDETDWRQQQRDAENAAWENMPGGWCSDAAEGMTNIGRKALPSIKGKKPKADPDTGAIVLVRPVKDGAGVLQFIYENQRGRFVKFPVAMTQTGGANGDSTNAATWTYTITDSETSEELGTAIDPTASPHLWKRPGAGKIAAATAGDAYYNENDELVVCWTNETVGGAVACP